MATRVGQDVDLISTDGGEGDGTKGRFVVWPGAATLLDQEVDRFLFASWDSGLPGRRYWLDTEDSDRNRPTAIGAFGVRVVLAKW